MIRVAKASRPWGENVAHPLKFTHASFRETNHHNFPWIFRLKWVDSYQTSRFQKLDPQPQPFGVMDEKGFPKNASMKSPEGWLYPLEAFFISYHKSKIIFIRSNTIRYSSKVNLHPSCEGRKFKEAPTEIRGGNSEYLKKASWMDKYAERVKRWKIASFRKGTNGVETIWTALPFTNLHGAR